MCLPRGGGGHVDRHVVVVVVVVDTNTPPRFAPGRFRFHASIKFMPRVDLRKMQQPRATRETPRTATTTAIFASDVTARVIAVFSELTHAGTRMSAPLAQPLQAPKIFFAAQCIDQRLIVRCA
jgi:hypothetical protein